MNEFTRSEMLLGSGAIKLLSRKTVMVFGIGGVGSFAAEALARTGVGTLVLIDHDTVSVTNINRQLHALQSTVGLPKVEIMAARIRDINPECTVIPKQIFYRSADYPDILDGADYVIDAIDTVSAKLELIVEAHRLGIPVVSSMGTGNKLNPSSFRIGDIYETSVCPLARVMRAELKKRGIHKLKVVWSDEPPIKTDVPGDELPDGKRSVPGSVIFCPAAAGLLLAREVVGELTKNR